MREARRNDPKANIHNRNSVPGPDPHFHVDEPATIFGGLKTKEEMTDTKPDKKKGNYGNRSR